MSRVPSRRNWIARCAAKGDVHAYCRFTLNECLGILEGVPNAKFFVGLDSRSGVDVLLDGRIRSDRRQTGGGERPGGSACLGAGGNLAESCASRRRLV